MRLMLIWPRCFLVWSRSRSLSNCGTISGRVGCSTRTLYGLPGPVAHSLASMAFLPAATAMAAPPAKISRFVALGGSLWSCAQRAESRGKKFRSLAGLGGICTENRTSAHVRSKTYQAVISGSLFGHPGALGCGFEAHINEEQGAKTHRTPPNPTRTHSNPSPLNPPKPAQIRPNPRKPRRNFVRAVRHSPR